MNQSEVKEHGHSLCKQGVSGNPALALRLVIAISNGCEYETFCTEYQSIVLLSWGGLKY